MKPYSNGELAQMEQAGKNAEHCVCCGDVIPEGRQVCPICENGRSKTKPRYLEAEKLKRQMGLMPMDFNTRDEMWMRESDIACYIDACSEADVVEVVRCRECRFSDEIGPGLYICHNEDIIIVGSYADSDWYCAAGKRKETKDE